MVWCEEQTLCCDAFFLIVRTKVVLILQRVRDSKEGIRKWMRRFGGGGYGALLHFGERQLLVTRSGSALSYGADRDFLLRARG